MSIDVFGRTSKKTASSVQGPRGIGFQLTSDGQYDMQKKRICNVDEPIDDKDAVTLSSVKKIINSEIQSKNIDSVTLNVVKNTIDSEIKLIESKINDNTSLSLNEIQSKINNNHILIMKLMKYFSETLCPPNKTTNKFPVYE